MDEFEGITNKLSSVMSSHFAYLEKKGMVCNRSKTELVLFNSIGGENLRLVSQTLVLNPNLQ